MGGVIDVDAGRGAKDSSMTISASFGDDVKDHLDAIFSGYACMASTSDFVQIALGRAARDIQEVSDMRYAASISGAMHWKWSQEFAINDGGPPRGL